MLLFQFINGLSPNLEKLHNQPVSVLSTGTETLLIRFIDKKYPQSIFVPKECVVEKKEQPSV